ncbi:MAG: ferrochelatase [Deltaproteobacteria bacterium]|nr:ferrochelatase [Deltaproteobacteria bacterium]
MAYGGPDSLADVEPFLLDIRGGRPTSQDLIDEIKSRYEQIGGRSPLLEISRAQAAALEELLQSGDHPETFQVYLGMRHWHPYISQAVRQIVADGHRRIIALCLAPHFSRMSVGAYFRKVEEAIAEVGAEVEVRWVRGYGDHPLFQESLAYRAKLGLQKFPVDEPEEVRVLFTAHSLPARILAEGDPYDAQLRATARGVADLLGDEVWEMCYQSAAAGAVDWLGPHLDQRIGELAAEGCRNVLVAPIGFISDHVEILFDIDIEARALAEQAGIRLERTESLNTAPGLIEAMADIVQRIAS